MLSGLLVGVLVAAFVFELINGSAHIGNGAGDGCGKDGKRKRNPEERRSGVRFRHFMNETGCNLEFFQRFAVTAE